MGDRSEAMRSLVELCTRWSRNFPQSEWNQGLVAATSGTFGQWLGAYPWPIGLIPNISRQDWQTLHDTGVRDTLEHATSILNDEHGFDLVLNHSIETNCGPRAIRVLLHSDGVLAQIEAAPSTDDGSATVSDIRLWGCAQVHDQPLFLGIPASTSPLRDGSRRNRRVALDRATGTFGVGWLATSAAVEWIAPWPEPMVRTWLGPGEPNPGQNGPDLEQASRLGRANTVDILERLPGHVHTTLGPITARFDRAGL